MELSLVQKGMERFLPAHLGIRIEQALPDEIRGSLLVTENLCTLPGVLHGGAVMAFADTLGAVATVINLPPGASTTTIESKTNFLSAGREGTTVTGVCTPLHKGRRTMVWQTRIQSPEGKLIAQVTQTQAVLEPRLDDRQALARLLDGKSADERKALFEGL